MVAPIPSPILVVHSDSNTRQPLVEILHTAGFAVVEAGDAREAVEAQGNAAALVAVAVQEANPIATGTSTVSHTLRQQWPGLRVITVGDEEDGADCCLQLPVQPAQLLLAVRLLLQQPAPAGSLTTPETHAATLATIAHDLRNALAPLRSAIAIMTRTTGNDEPSRKPVLAMMEKQVGQMVGLIDSLSEEARRIEGRAGAVPVNAATASPVNVAPMAGALTPGASGNGRGRRVLVADDSHAVQDSVGALLRSQGYEVRTASDGLEALETAGSWLPDYVLVDMRMPRLDGFGLARRLRADFPERAMKIILMSGISLDSVLLRHARAAGFDVCIDKVSPPEQWFVHLADSN